MGVMYRCHTSCPSSICAARSTFLILETTIVFTSSYRSYCKSIRRPTNYYVTVRAYYPDHPRRISASQVLSCNKYRPRTIKNQLQADPNQGTYQSHYSLRSSSSSVGFWKNAIQGCIISSGI